MKKILAVMMASATVFAGAIGLSACGESGDKTGMTPKDWDKTITVGVTDYEPMDYRTKSGEWTGFDAELASTVFNLLGYNVKFVEIDWETKIVTLEAGTINCIWNGMTVTDELTAALSLTDPYLENRQYGLVKTENQADYNSVASLAGKKVAYESGSAAAGLLEGVDCTKNNLGTQSAAVMEVAAGTSDAAIVDYTMARTLTAEGSDYYGRLSAVDLGFEAEEFAVGFRKEDTELCQKVNAQLKILADNGFIRELAKKYGIENLLKG